jgi:signal transduction histidine kinase
METALPPDETPENARILRLEHDLKSPLGVILGYCTLLREFVQSQPDRLSALPLKSVDGIDQAAKKMLQIIETAARLAEPNNREPVAGSE